MKLAQPRQSLIAIVGPTASGKTSLAIELAQRHHGEIICADSRTVYRGLDIGTAKPTAAERAAVPHYGLDLIEPGQSFTVADFKRYAEQTIADIWQRGKYAFLVGGSGLYLDAVLFNYQFRSQDGGEDFSALDNDTLVKLAAARYPNQFAAIDTNNRRRVAQLLSRGPAAVEDRRVLKYQTLIIGLNLERPLLKQKITKRLDSQLNNGFVQEVASLRKRYGADCSKLQTIGYRELGQYLDNKIDFTSARLQIIQAEMALARRQMTWLRRNPAVQWIRTPIEAKPLISAYLQVDVEPGVE